ncbi:MAG: hemolysin family protein [Cyanobacteria bacterium P01_A01_bin.105]
MTGTDAAVRLLVIALLIALNAFFVAAEFAIVSVRRSRINQLAAGGDLQAKTVQSLQQSIEQLLSSTQLGITLSSLALGWIGEHTMAQLLVHGLATTALPLPLTEWVSHSVALTLAFIIIAYLQIVLGELCPKTIALRYPERVARVIGPTSLTIAHLFTPFIWVLNRSTQTLLRGLPMDPLDRDSTTQLTPEELQLIISTSTATPDLVKAEREILNNVFEFRDVTVEEIMVPRTQIKAIEETATFQDLINEMADTGYTRYPVVGESLDDVRGIIRFKELAQPMAQGQIQGHTPICTWVRPARYVPADLHLNELLTRMQESRQAMMIVVDDYGGTAGLVTLQDLTAEIIGEEEDPATLTGGLTHGPIVLTDEQSAVVLAQTDVETVNEQLGLSLPVIEDYQTLAGFVIFHLQKIPEAGERLLFNNLELVVIATTGPKIEQIKIISLNQRLQPSRNVNR